jgi:AraC family transcriptional regulator
MAADESCSGLMADYLARALAARLLTRGQTSLQTAKSPSLSQSQRARVQDYIRAHLAHPIGLADLAAITGTSQTAFARAFKRSFGTSPYRYLVQERVQQASRMLTATTMPIAEIALASGFSHQEHLTRLFHRETGTTPAAYRRRAS